MKFCQLGCDDSLSRRKEWAPNIGFNLCFKVAGVHPHVQLKARIASRVLSRISRVGPVTAAVVAIPASLSRLRS
jgi:hypothetical protein